MAKSDDPQKTQADRAHAKKRAKKVTSAKKVTETPAAAEANPATSFDRSQLTEKTRVFQLAKTLGIPSKTLIIALSEMGLVKVAQSSLTRAESNALLDALANAPEKALATSSDAHGAQDDATAGGADKTEEKIRERVRKDVQNEIKQIETKVERDLEAIPEAIPEASPESSTESSPENGEEVDDDEPLTDVEPDVTPAPEVVAAPEFVPLFKAPARSDRRRATRASTSEGADTHDKASAPAETPSKAHTAQAAQDKAAEDESTEVEVIDEPKAIRGSSRLEAQRRRRTEKREEDRKRSKIVSQAEFLARRESVERTMVVRERERRDGSGTITQVGVLEDGLLVEHFVTSDQNTSMIGNIYLGRVQNVLPSMEAAFIDIGQARNGVLYAGEVDWKTAGLGGRSRRIENALKSGDQVVVQVTKDPIGHKGARLTTQISLAGRFLVYVPGGRSAGISRKLPAPERKRLKEILGKVVPGKGGTIIRTAAEGVPEDAIAADVNRLHSQWEEINRKADEEKKSKGAKPVTLYEEPNLLIKVIRDLFNEDFANLIVDGRRPWNTVHAYVSSVAPDLTDRLVKYDRSENDGQDAFETYRIDEQIQKALSRTVWLPSGGTLIIERTEAMTVVDVNTGKFTGSGGSLEETVTRNNLEAAEEIVRQMRLRDLGGMIVVDFIDMILPENQELVLRRLKEALGRDRTRHQVSEVTSLGLVQMTRKRLGTGLLETFSAQCECCSGRGIVLTEDPVDSHEDLTEEHGNKAAAHGKRPSQFAEQEHTHDEPQEPADKVRDITLDEDALDELVSSVISGERGSDSNHNGDSKRNGDSERDSVTEGEREDEREGQSRGRRRGRRGGGRGRGRASSEDDSAVKDSQTKDSEINESETGDSEPEFSDTEARKSFEKAVAEFESSPRRGRRTRGNSRSDHRPTPEEFESENAEAAKPANEEPAKDTEKSSELENASADRGGAGRGTLPVKQNASTRTRRRAVRRSAVSQTPDSGSETRSGTRTQSHNAERSTQGGRASGSTPGRGRRRASRRQTP